MRSKQILLPFLFLWFTSSVAAQRTGGISGTVLTEDGHPVRDDHASAEVMDGEKIITVLVAQTDEHGRFAFTGIGFWEVSPFRRKAGFEFRLLVPSNIEIRFGACSEGYKRWVYPEPLQPSRVAPLKLKPDFEAKIEIKLEPSSDPRDASCWSSSY